MTEERQTGVVRKLIVDGHRSKFGFIDTGGKELFFHAGHVLDVAVPVAGERVTFVIGEDRQHRPMAMGVRRVRSNEWHRER